MSLLAASVVFLLYYAAGRFATSFLRKYGKLYGYCPCYENLSEKLAVFMCFIQNIKPGMGRSDKKTALESG